MFGIDLKYSFLLIILHFKMCVLIFNFLYLPRKYAANDFHDPSPSAFNNLIMNLILWALILTEYLQLLSHLIL